ncbi:unnamed protein product [Medioppia subpectinata]|uniref:Uncharacterized protein n=1 Tax=Medioppia subpectinata TaxID=1979941 RepID=A0A7R9LKS4_9ACAR|nr:unnamed protein product [Medioppia subpectinata]CAG2119673.1 unnamed protein product [Medioppia subpectinata]
MTTTLSGLPTIRAFKVQDLFVRQYYRHQNDHTSAYFMCISASRVLGVTMDWLCVSYLFCVTLFLMVYHKDLESGSAGLAFTLAMGLAGMAQWGVRQSAECETQMVSVERIVEYSGLEPETEPTDSVQSPPREWLQTGRIEFVDVSLRYPNRAELALNGLNLVFTGGQRVGVVGRTGAGKSSLVAALFRLHPTGGRILIDGVDHRTVPVGELRRRLSVAPQEAIVFGGSVRHNLDPFDEHRDDRLWEALEAVQLRQALLEMPAQLAHELTDGGANLSVGQRQLLCLARAILRRSRILVLDEATASVDPETDALIQRAIGRHFAAATVLTIAHRLHTVIDSDQVLVMDAGRAVEYGPPHELLASSESVFYGLVAQTGPQMAAELRRAAKQAYDERRSGDHRLD